jgi:hypothetical protein
MAEEGPWLTLTEAAQRSGLPRESIRARARRGLIPSRKDNRHQTLVQLPADLLTRAGQGLAGAESGILAGVPMDMADLMAEVAELREQLARAESAVEAAKAVAKAEVATAEARGEAQVAALRELVDELKAQLAEARRPWWQRWFR